MRTLRVAMAQINALVGDLEHNAATISRYIEKAKKAQADLVSFPELALTGYPPEDLVYKPRFVRDNLFELGEIAAKYPDIVAVVGFVDQVADKLYNSAAVLFEGKVQAVYHKKHLPNYGVFDEKRYFESGTNYVIVELNKVNIGINVCEDVWYTEPINALVEYGAAEVIINVNSSPYSLDKLKQRQDNLSRRSKENQVYIAYNNMVGGQDELVFDGGAMLFNPVGHMAVVGKRFEEDLVISDLEFDDKKRQPTKEKTPELEAKFKILTISHAASERTPITKKMPSALQREEEIYKALVLGVRDYVHKNNFSKALIALSGGIDSALSATIAADALGAKNLLCLFLPSSYSSKESHEDALATAQNLGIKIEEIPIQDLYENYLAVLKPWLDELPISEAEENIQARIRGNIAMAFSNKFGYIVLSTGNKSELSVGYSTLYGDMAGGFAVLKDVYKTEVYSLTNYRNKVSEVIPQRVLTKAPSAELRPGQKDQDTLPPYNVLDAILKLYVEKFKTANEIIAVGYPKDAVTKTVHMVDINEYKRRQAPPGIKITPRAFGRDRRMPITQGYLMKK